MIITSLTNTRIKNVIQLRNRKHRIQTGLTIVEGRREVIRALEAGVPLRKLYVCDELLNASKIDDIGAETFTRKLSSKVSICKTTKTVFSKISYGDRVEGVLAVCAPQPASFEKLRSKSKSSLYVVVESVEKSGNLGAILRTCDGAGVDGVIVCDGKTDIYNPNVIRASLGTVFSGDVVVSSNKETAEFLKSQKVTICATSLQAKTVYTKANFTEAIAVVVGSEQNGLTNFWIQNAHLKVKIPMSGHADSLNVSASTAILLYEIIRQRSN